MPYTIYPSDDRKYIVVEHVGEINGELGLSRIQEAHALGKKLDIHRFLIELTEAKNADTISASYNYAYKDMENPPGVNPNARAAMLVSPEDHSHDFVETVLRNAGHNVRLFRDRGLAVEYLLKP